MPALKPRPVLIAGPTASGKSALALRLAERCNGTIVNTDSMQVYRDLRIITARPSPADEAAFPHRLYGHVDASENYSVGRWLADARAALDQARGEGRTPIFVGGSGLYFKLLTRGVAPVPPIPDAIRVVVRNRIAAEGAPALHAELQRRDPIVAARLHPGDAVRIGRALEVLEATGRPLSAWQDENLPPAVVSADTCKVFISPERGALRARIEQRFDAMLSAGALAEVRALVVRDLDPSLPAMKAHGVPWLARHLRGEITLDEASMQAKADTRRYAKRQFTWFRNQLPDWPWETPATAFDRLLAELAR